MTKQAVTGLCVLVTMMGGVILFLAWVGGAFVPANTIAVCSGGWAGERPQVIEGHRVSVDFSDVVVRDRDGRETRRVLANTADCRFYRDRAQMQADGAK